MSGMHTKVQGRVLTPAGFIDGELATTLRGTYEELDEGFRALVDHYVATHYRIR